MKLKLLFLFSCLICCLTAEKVTAQMPDYGSYGYTIVTNGGESFYEGQYVSSVIIDPGYWHHYTGGCPGGSIVSRTVGGYIKENTTGSWAGYATVTYCTCSGGTEWNGSSCATSFTKYCAEMDINYEVGHGGCSKCIQGYLWVYPYGDDGCIPCPEHGICDGSSTLACTPGYTVNYLSCEKDCPDNCQSCSSGGYCTQCKSGNYLSGGKCYICPDNAVCSTTGGWSCISGYNKVGNACVPQNVISCPSRMTLSSNGNCCVNK